MGLMYPKDGAGSTPGCHALIVGVSGYPFLGPNARPMDLGLRPLSSGALSAYYVYQWICKAKLAVPLASVRLLLSPAEGDTFDAGIEPATLDRFIHDVTDWREDANSHPANMSFFYFAGHGFSLPQGEQVLALQDFGDGIGPALRHSIAVNNLVAGMAPSLQPQVAKTQLYFIDANRRRVTALEQYPLVPTAVFDAGPIGVDDRATAIFYAATETSDTYAYIKQRTFFSDALIACLEGAAAERLGTLGAEWGVSVQSLARELPVQVSNRASEAGIAQTVLVEGSLRNSVISLLDTRPLVDVSIRVQLPTPDDEASVRLSNEDGDVVGEWNAVKDQILRVPAGLYLVDVRGAMLGQAFKKRRFLDAAGPSVDLHLDLTKPL